jgi:hypothetical protein
VAFSCAQQWKIRQGETQWPVSLEMYALTIEGRDGRYSASIVAHGRTAAAGLTGFIMTQNVCFTADGRWTWYR